VTVSSSSSSGDESNSGDEVEDEIARVGEEAIRLGLLANR
jgi:hypothetical protein